MKVIVKGEPNLEKLAEVLNEIFTKIKPQQEQEQEKSKAG
jgi:hypothetical protein